MCRRTQPCAKTSPAAARRICRRADDVKMNSPETLQASFSVIGIVIVVVVWALSALLKRKEDNQTELPPEVKGPPRSRNASQPPVAKSWEEELRRVLGQPAATPPPIVREATRPAPPVPRPRL